MEDFDIDEIFDRSHQGTNWMLPAFDQQDAIYLSSSRQMLEPIMEETSEDEEGSSHSYNQYENGAWSSESETGSVIRIELTNDQDSISERGLACPAKRARRDLDLNLLLNSSQTQQQQQQQPQQQLIQQPPPQLLQHQPPVSTTTLTNNNSFNNSSHISTNTNPLVSSSSSSASSTNNNHHHSYTISGLIDSPQNIRKFQTRTNTNNNNNDSLAIGSLLDSPVADLPIFRKRFDDFNQMYSDSDSLSYNSLSRSSSLIQFESLERQLQNDLSSSSVGSSPSLLSFDATTDNSISNNLNHRGSNGSLKRFESSDSRLHQTYYDLDKIDFDKNTPSLLFRTGRALSEERQSKSDSESSSDNSILSHEERILVRPANSLNQTPTHCLDSSTRRNSSVSGSSRTKSSAENLSEDSGYCEHYQPLRTKSKSIPSFEKFCEEDEFENHKSLENIRYNPLPSRRSSDSSTGSDDETSKHSICEDSNTKMLNFDENLNNNETIIGINNCYSNNSSGQHYNNNIKDKNSKLISSKTITTTTATTISQTSQITSKYSTASSKFSSSSSSTSPASSSSCSSDEDYCTQSSSIVTLKVPTTAKLNSYNQNKQQQQQNENGILNFANTNNAIMLKNRNTGNSSNNYNNNSKSIEDNFNTINNSTLVAPPPRPKSSHSNCKSQLKYACPEEEENNSTRTKLTYSAIRISPASSLSAPYTPHQSSSSASSSASQSPFATASSITTDTDTTTSTSPMNSYFPTNSSSLPDVRGEYNTYQEERDQFKLNRHCTDNSSAAVAYYNHHHPKKNILYNNNNNKNLIVRNSISRNSTIECNNSSCSSGSNYHNNREFCYNNSNNNHNNNNSNRCESIATQNKIFRIDCTSPDPIDDYDTIIVFGKPPATIISSNPNFQLIGQKSLSSDQLEKYSDAKRAGTGNSLIDDKYLTERSSVPKDLNLLGNDTEHNNHLQDNSASNNRNNHNNSHESHNNSTAIREEFSTSKQFYLHNQHSSGYESLTNCSQDNNCYDNNICSDNDNFDASELSSFKWNETTTVVKRGNNNSANEKRAIFASNSNSNNNKTIVTIRNKNKQKRHSGEYNDFTNNSKSLNSGLNYMNASYQDLTVLDYTGKNRNSMDGTNSKRGSREIVVIKRNSLNDSNNEVSKGNYLLDEISENFDKNLSILSDRKEDSVKLKEFINTEKMSSEGKPSAPTRPNRLSRELKIETISSEPNRPPIKKPPRRHLKSHQHHEKQPKTFDIDPSIMKTSYAESLERCNFDPKEISTQDLTDAIIRSRSPIYSTPIKRTFVASSTPNLYSFKVDKITDDFDDLKISSASNSMQKLPQDKKLGILVSSGSKQSLGKSVNFCPVVAEYSFRERSESYDPDSLEEVNDPILLANTVANEKFNSGGSNNNADDIFDGKNSHCIGANNNSANKRILRETNFEWNANSHDNDHRNDQQNIEKPQKVIATIINNTNNCSNIMIATTTTPTTISLPKTTNNINTTITTTNNNGATTTSTTTTVSVNDQQSKTCFSKETNANEASCCYEGGNNNNNSNKQNNGDGIITVKLNSKNNNKNLIDVSEIGDKIKEKNKTSSNSVNNYYRNSYDNSKSSMLKMEQNNMNVVINVPSIQNGINNLNDDDHNNIENNIKNITKNLIQSEKYTNINNNNNYNNGTNNGTSNNNNNNNNKNSAITTTVTTTKIITTPTKKIQNSIKSNSMPSVKTYSSAGNSPQQTNTNSTTVSSSETWKSEYTQNPHLATTVPLNPANNNELLNAKFKAKSDDKNKSSFLSRFAGNFRFSLRRKPKKTLPNEPMPTSVTEQKQALAKNHRNIFGVGVGSKKKSIADGAVKSKSSKNNSNSSTKSASSRDSRESPDFIYIPLKGPIPSNNHHHHHNNNENQQFNNIDAMDIENITEKFNNNSNSVIQEQEQQQQNGYNNSNNDNNHMLSQVTGKPPLPKQPPRIIIGEKCFTNQQFNQQQNNNNKTNNILNPEEKLLSSMSSKQQQKRANSNNAQYNGEFNYRREIRSQSQPKDGDAYSMNVGNILDKFLDNERYIYSKDYQFDEAMNGNGSYNSNNKMNYGYDGIQQQQQQIPNGCNKLSQQNGSKNFKNNHKNINYGADGGDGVGGGGGNFNNDYVPPPSQFTDEKPPSGKIRKSSGTGANTIIIGGGGGSVSNNNKNKIGLIETNLDTHETIISGKTQSLMELGPNHSTRNNYNKNIILRQQNDQIDDDDDDDVDVNVDGSNHHHHHHHHGSIRRPHKSMEFLLDKENQKNAAPPENELQKSHDSTAALSEHQLRVQASLQRLNIPDWYRAYSSTSTKTGTETVGVTGGTGNNLQASGYKPGNFTRKRASDSGRWAGLNSKTTSLSSLGSQRSDRSPLLLSPSAHSHHGTTITGGCGTTSSSIPVSGGFSRWSTSYLNSTQTSPSVSQRGSFSRGGPINSSFSSVGCGGSVAGGHSGASSIVRSSFRQPYMGWRSQEKINQPRTPHERLASSLLSAKPPKTEQVAVTQEIQSSIKEVTSAIVHHFNDQNRQQPTPGTNLQATRSRSTSPNSRKCWLESSFVGVRPLESPQTPTIETNTFTSSSTGASTSATIINQQQQQQLQQQQYQQQQQQQQPQHQQQQIQFLPNNRQPIVYDPVSTFRTHTNTPQQQQQQQRYQQQQPQQQYQPQLSQQSDIIRINGVGESTII